MAAAFVTVGLDVIVTNISYNLLISIMQSLQAECNLMQVLDALAELMHLGRRA